MKNTKTEISLGPDLARVLAAVASTSLSPTTVISSITRLNAREPLQVLHRHGYVLEHSAMQTAGAPSLLYSITAKGAEALRSAEKESIMATVGPLPARAQGQSAPPAKLYDGSEMRPSTVRPGSMDAFKYPSRVGNRLHHADGTVTKIEL